MFHEKAFSSNIKSNHIKDNICKSSNDSFICKSRNLDKGQILNGSLGILVFSNRN